MGSAEARGGIENARFVLFAASEREMRPLIKDCKRAQSSNSKFYEKMKDRVKLLSIH